MRFWIGVACQEHVQRGIAGGFCQLCHGKAAPLRRMQQGDWLIYYSAKLKMNQPAPCQQFTAIGRISGASIYPVQMSADFLAQRRDVEFLPARAVAIHSLLGQLSFIRDPVHWGYAFRFGHLEIPRADFELIAEQMLGTVPILHPADHQLSLLDTTYV